jgi:hypothetical protein
MHLINLIIVEIIINCNDPISNNSLSNGNIITSRSSQFNCAKMKKHTIKRSGAKTWKRFVIS